MELSFYDRASAIYTKDMLIDPPAVGAVDTPVNVKLHRMPDMDTNRSIPEMNDPY
jgi:hypothetical protein